MLNNIFLAIYTIAISFTAVVLYKYYSKKILILLGILLSGCVNTIFLSQKTILGISAIVSSNIYVIIQFILWFYLGKECYQHLKSVIINFSIAVYLVITLVSFFFFEGFFHFNHFNFVAGTFFYLIPFSIESFMQLKNENTNYFSSNNFILSMAPVSYFIGLSLLFAFKNPIISKQMLFTNISLFDLITTTINAIYAALVFIFLIKEAKREVLSDN